MRPDTACEAWHDSENPAPTAAVAAIGLPLIAATILYCRHHLNEYLDIADDNPHMEPASLEWLTVA